MAVTTGTMLAISAGVSAAGALAQGVAAKRAGDAQAARDEMAARQQQDAAGAEADRIRRAGERAKGAARAQLAASGIQVDTGSALLIDEDIGRRVEDDAFNTLLTGSRQAGAYRLSAAQSRASGRNALTASALGAVSTGIQGWKGVSARQADPLGDFIQRGKRGSGD